MLWMQEGKHAINFKFFVFFTHCWSWIGSIEFTSNTFIIISISSKERGQIWIFTWWKIDSCSRCGARLIRFIWNKIKDTSFCKGQKYCCNIRSGCLRYKMMAMDYNGNMMVYNMQILNWSFHKQMGCSTEKNIMQNMMGFLVLWLRHLNQNYLFCFAISERIKNDFNEFSSRLAKELIWFVPIFGLESNFVEVNSPLRLAHDFKSDILIQTSDSFSFSLFFNLNLSNSLSKSVSSWLKILAYKSDAFFSVCGLNCIKNIHKYMYSVSLKN